MYIFIFSFESIASEYFVLNIFYVLLKRKEKLKKILSKQKIKLKKISKKRGRPRFGRKGIEGPGG